MSDGTPEDQHDDDSARHRSSQNGYGNRDPVRTYRAPDSVYAPALAVAKERGEALSQVVRRALVAYVKEQTPPPESRHRRPPRA